MSRTRLSTIRWVGGLASVAGIVGLATAAGDPDRGGAAVVVNHDPAQIVGPDACAECHTNEHSVWMGSAHQSGSLTLTRSDEAKAIASALGVRRIKTDERCASCHYTSQQTEGATRPKSIAGVSCESCHSAAASWMDTHSRFGPGASTASEETPQHRTERLNYCDTMGMIRPARLYELGAACYSCHAIHDQELIDVGGHPVGDGFEFASWSQGGMRHNFVRAGADQNPVSEPDRLRVMFLVGAALRLEHACLAVEQGAPAKGITDAVAALEAILEAAPMQAVSALIEIGREVEGAADASVATNAAARVRVIGQAIAEERVGADQEALDTLIPEPRPSKGQ